MKGKGVSDDSTKNTNSVINDIKSIKGHILGVIAFATGVSAYLIKICSFPESPTIVVASGISILMLVICWLINKAEQRNIERLKTHSQEVKRITDKYNSTLTKLQDMLLENTRSGLRVEMNTTMHFSPENHDTIIKMAERYFITLRGDWVETDVFLNWVDQEKNNGRPVHVPPQLLSAVTGLKEQENK